jgi:hypothetical protein
VKLIKINLPYFVSTVQANIGAQESFVRKVCLWWGVPFEKTAMSSLARELKILVSVVRFRPGPPRILKTLDVAH